MPTVQVKIPSAQELDAQSPVKVDEWVEVGSPKFFRIVGDIGTFNYFIQVGFRDPPFFYRDELGRVWARYQNEGRWYPFHDVVRGKTYGYKYASAEKN